MLNIVTLNEKMNQNTNSSVHLEGYITEVLHREYMNVSNEQLIEQACNSILVLPNHHHHHHQHNLNNQQQQQNSILNQINLNSSNNFILTNSPSSSCIKQQQHQQQQQHVNLKPQIIKLQPFIPTNNQAQTHHQQQVMLTSPNNASSPISKPVLYSHPQMAQQQHSPLKLSSGKLVKLQSNQNQTETTTTTTTAVPIESLLNLNEIKSEPVITSQENNNNNNQIITIQQPGQSQQQQVLNLVLVTDGVNGGVSYLSLVPQN